VNSARKHIQQKHTGQVCVLDGRRTGTRVSERPIVKEETLARKQTREQTYRENKKLAAPKRHELTITAHRGRSGRFRWPSLF
jgi:hypothetical protein